jgi:hypothetical protein
MITHNGIPPLAGVTDDVGVGEVDRGVVDGEGEVGGEVDGEAEEVDELTVTDAAVEFTAVSVLSVT